MKLWILKMLKMYFWMISKNRIYLSICIYQVSQYTDTLEIKHCKHHRKEWDFNKRLQYTHTAGLPASVFKNPALTQMSEARYLQNRGQTEAKQIILGGFSNRISFPTILYQHECYCYIRITKWIKNTNRKAAALQDSRHYENHECYKQDINTNTRRQTIIFSLYYFNF